MSKIYNLSIDTSNPAIQEAAQQYAEAKKQYEETLEDTPVKLRKKKLRNIFKGAAIGVGIAHVATALSLAFINETRGGIPETQNFVSSYLFINALGASLMGYLIGSLTGSDKKTAQRNMDRAKENLRNTLKSEISSQLDNTDLVEIVTTTAPAPQKLLKK